MGGSCSAVMGVHARHVPVSGSRASGVAVSCSHVLKELLNSYTNYEIDELTQTRRIKRFNWRRKTLQISGLAASLICRL